MNFSVPPVPQPSVAPAQKASPRSVLGILFLSDCLAAVFVLCVLLLFAHLYHALKASADLFHAATNCASVAASQQLPGPCRVEWGNVVRRYYQSSKSAKTGSTYRYYLQVRGAYGDRHTIELKDERVWWRTANGIALKLQHWGNVVTAVELPTGESSLTAQNPAWQLQNDLRALRTLSLIEIVLLVFAAISGTAWRMLPA